MVTQWSLSGQAVNELSRVLKSWLWYLSCDTLDDCLMIISMSGHSVVKQLTTGQVLNSWLWYISSDTIHDSYDNFNEWSLSGQAINDWSSFEFLVVIHFQRYNTRLLWLLGLLMNARLHKNHLEKLSIFFHLY